MAALAWLLIPLMAAVGAGMWGSWAARNRRAGDVTELAGYARFRAAMQGAAMEGSEEVDEKSEISSLMGSESGTDAA